MQSHLYLQELEKAASQGKTDFSLLIGDANEKIIEDLCEVVNVEQYGELTATKLKGAKGLTKEQLSGYLATVCRLLGKFVKTQLMKDEDLKDDMGAWKREADRLKDEKLADQTTIIELQGKLIQSKEEQLKSVETTIQTELKTYSAVLEKSGIIAEKKIAAAIKKIPASKQVKRKSNLIIFGVKEEEEEAVDGKVIEVLAQLDEKPRISNCCRVGRSKVGARRPIKFTVGSDDLAYQILGKAAQLKKVDGYHSIYISPDRTVEQQLAYRSLVIEVKKKREEEPNRIHFIRNYKVLSAEKDSVSNRD